MAQCHATDRHTAIAYHAIHPKVSLVTVQTSVVAHGPNALLQAKYRQAPPQYNRQRVLISDLTRGLSSNLQLKIFPLR